VHTAIKAVDAIGGRLILAGQGQLGVDTPCCEVIGYVEPEERAELMGKAIATFVPTLYLEAFGGVNVEAQLCGTPPIATNFGVFPETILDGRTGFLCNTLDDFISAAIYAHKLDPHVIRRHAERYLTTNVRWEFQRWFDDLYDLYESARDDEPTGWHRIRKEEPGWRQEIYGRDL
jgi:glycosyltransferase involved in cell wall biosynthesis